MVGRLNDGLGEDCPWDTAALGGTIQDVAAWMRHRLVGVVDGDMLQFGPGAALVRSSACDPLFFVFYCLSLFVCRNPPLLLDLALY